MNMSDTDLQWNIDNFSSATAIGSLARTVRAAREAARSIIACPQGELWNYGTRPSHLEEMKFRGRVEAAEEILGMIS